MRRLLPSAVTIPAADWGRAVRCGLVRSTRRLEAPRAGLEPASAGSKFLLRNRHRTGDRGKTSPLNRRITLDTTRAQHAAGWLELDWLRLRRLR